MTSLDNRDDWLSDIGENGQHYEYPNPLHRWRPGDPTPEAITEMMAAMQEADMSSEEEDARRNGRPPVWLVDLRLGAMQRAERDRIHFEEERSWRKHEHQQAHEAWQCRRRYAAL